MRADTNYKDSRSSGFMFDPHTVISLSHGLTTMLTRRLSLFKLDVMLKIFNQDLNRSYAKTL